MKSEYKTYSGLLSSTRNLGYKRVEFGVQNHAARLHIHNIGPSDVNIFVAYEKGFALRVKVKRGTDVEIEANGWIRMIHGSVKRGAKRSDVDVITWR